MLETNETTDELLNQNNHRLSAISQLLLIQDKQNKMPSFVKIPKKKKPNQERAEKVKNILIGIKAKMLRDLFIKKLQRNIHSPSNTKILPEEKRMSRFSFKIRGSQIPQTFEHIMIVLCIISHVILLFITSLTATIGDFARQVATTQVVLALKIFCISVFGIRIITSLIAINFKRGFNLVYIHQIAKDYLISISAFIDIVITLLLVFILIFPSNFALHAVFFVILTLTFLKPVSQLISLQSAYIHNKDIALLWQLTKLILFNILIAHIVCTVLLAMVHISDNNWLVQHQIYDEPWAIKFAVAYYWGMIIAITVGFGDISPVNYREQIVVAFLALFGCLILGFNLSEFANIFSSYRRNENFKKIKAIAFKRMLTRDQNNNAAIDPMLKKKIYRFIQNSSIDQEYAEFGFMQKNTFVAGLPDYLRKAYMKASNKRIFQSVLFFNQLRDQTLTLLGEVFKSHYFSPEEDVHDPAIFISILEEGKIGLTYKKDGSTINGIVMDDIKVDKKESLALLTPDFISMYKRTTNYGLICLKYSYVWTIKIERFKQVLSNDSNDYEHYFANLHKHPLDFDEWQTKLCPRCTTGVYKSYHTVFRCPKVTYLASRKMVIFRQLKNTAGQQQRIQFFIRRKNNHFKTSILKYYRNFDQVLEISKMMLEDQKNYVSNFFNLKGFSTFSQANDASSYRNVDRNRLHSYDPFDPKANEDDYLQVDAPENFQHYFPRYNACNLIFRGIDSSIEGNKTPKRTSNYNFVRKASY